ncbi:hypothetical protein PVAND_008545 [Polypedilum vanderplanki]|uniref:TRUD domain-containing protein n=1 Tax=Polypedilum vanderplanki TaxID=319348 RepID=A0A9J6CA36_POLVA|nr:hypothetical protein PVAND_008545 [Polypedilum vanderplanki]
MGRDQKGFHNRRHFHKKNHHNSKNVDRSWQTEKRLIESEVGIEKYVNDLKGFQGIIKSRFSDFHVNEIDLNNQQAIFDDIKIPEISDLEKGLDKDGVELKIEDFIDEEKRKEIDELLKNNDYHKSVLIEVTDEDKDYRANLHKIMRKTYGGKTINNTITTGTGKKYIQVKKYGKNDQKDQRGWQWPEEYVHFILFKENIDTLQAISQIAKSLHLKASSFNYCGTKDKRAKTSQWISVRKVDPSKIVNAARRLQGIRVGNFKFSKTPLKLGDLKGNRFQIALRSVTADEETINQACESVKENGFINYYGMQRFGNCVEVPTHDIGRALLKSDFKLAVDLILKEREGEPNFMKNMRECWKNTENATEALKFINQRKQSFIEIKVLQSLAKSNNNYLQALQALPRNMLMLYTHAYQSLIFNKIASKRRELGLKVLEGDLVFKEENSIDVQHEAVIEENIEVTENEEESNEEETITTEIENESKYINMVRPLTKEDVDSGKYSIFDIVLVLPGHDVQYPKGIIGDYYQELLSKDDLTPEKFINKQKVFSLGGAYRKVFVKPIDFQWKILNYESPNDNIILSDYSRIMKDPEIESKPNGEHRALILDFKLPQSTYATMLLRELLKTDTSTQTQIQLQKGIDESNVEKESLKRKLDEDKTDADPKVEEKILKLE